ncbi:hypothetical protein DFP72DRAFT_887962 [Ephemerocybe angulata]|uniref:Uncharacterized protein n=1 Tax=Ephemerocybe angulata TaxID=980116 RepID=A0A8H6MB51_9AGAR|nr:hypothetical protein DFP72DRAFT_887962 [Tulosesus angulatus]
MLDGLEIRAFVSLCFSSSLFLLALRSAGCTTTTSSLSPKRLFPLFCSFHFRHGIIIYSLCIQTYGTHPYVHTYIHAESRLYSKVVLVF